jgi:hypothetical protein
MTNIILNIIFNIEYYIQYFSIIDIINSFLDTSQLRAMIHYVESLDMVYMIVNDLKLMLGTASDSEDERKKKTEAWLIKETSGRYINRKLKIDIISKLT